MAEKKNSSGVRSTLKKNKEISKLLDFIDQGMTDIYKDTYFTTDQNKRDLEKTSSDIDIAIDNIMAKRSQGYGISNISKLINRSISQQSISSKDNQELASDIESFFSGNNEFLSNMAMFNRQNRYIKEYDEQIDLICKYYSKLEDTIDTKIDNILSADHFTKDFLNILSLGISEKDRTEILAKIKTIREAYDYDKNTETWLYNIIKYGEQFVYIAPYKRAVERLLRLRNNGSIMRESTSITELISEDTDIQVPSNFKGFEPDSVSININLSGVIENAVENMIKANEALVSNVLSLYEESILENAEDGTSPSIRSKRNISKAVDDSKFEFPGSNDGFINYSKDNSNSEESIMVNGAIVKSLKRENVKPIYIDSICIGYLYVETTIKDLPTTNLSQRYANFSTSSKLTNYNNSTENTEDAFLDNIASKIGEYVDSKFINNNADIKNEIYLMLKYNIDHNKTTKSINVTFIPPEDMVHMYFKMDEDTHRGISELDASIIPATLYIGLYISYILGTMTRGYDKRVYYVKQNVETNVAKTMLNTVNQIKKNNFNLRSFNTVYNVLDIVGKYNDYIIPLSKSGDAPIQFDIMPGQEIRTNDELLNLLEELILGPTGVSKELIDSRNSLDYAIQATMSNSKFLRKMLRKQADFTPFLNRSFTMIYNYEYDTKEQFEITLPAPQILNLNNVNQIINANNEYINTITESELSHESDDVKAIFRKKMTRYNLGSHIPFNIVDKFIKDSKAEASLIASSDEQ